MSMSRILGSSSFGSAMLGSPNVAAFTGPAVFHILRPFQPYINYSHKINGTSGPAPTPPSTVDTHDGWIPKHLIHRFYERERLKHSKVIQAYKKLVKAEEEVEEIRESIAPYTPDTSRLTKGVLSEIAEDRAALGKLLNAIDVLEKRLAKYQQDAEDDGLLMMVAGLI